jgi:hypothetical protein
MEYKSEKKECQNPVKKITFTGQAVKKYGV